MENGHAWLLVAAIFDLTRELAKRLHVGETWCVVLLEGNVDEASHRPQAGRLYSGDRAAACGAFPRTPHG
jgi:hypothetical protein